MAEYYSDGVTKITDPFYKCVCRECLHRFWSVTRVDACPRCSKKNVYCTFDSTAADAEAAQLKKQKGFYGNRVKSE